MINNIWYLTCVSIYALKYKRSILTLQRFVRSISSSNEFNPPMGLTCPTCSRKTGLLWILLAKELAISERRAFSAVALHFWNIRSVEVRSAPTLPAFLKTWLCWLAYGPSRGAQCWGLQMEYREDPYLVSSDLLFFF